MLQRVLGDFESVSSWVAAVKTIGEDANAEK
jgi:hypothetical protein